MISHWTKDEFEEFTIAQADDEDYQESGYVAAVRDGVAYLSSYSHCSCYGTFDALCGGGISDWFDEEGDPQWDWTGSVDELVAMAKRCADPSMPEREATSGDCDYDHLQDVYNQILSWERNNGT